VEGSVAHLHPAPETAAPDPPPAVGTGGRGWCDASEADRTDAQHSLDVLLRLLLLLAIAAADLIFIKATFDRLLRESSWASWLAAAALTLAGLAAAVAAGSSLRAAWARGGSRWSWFGAAAAGAAWAGIGAVVVALRWNSAALAPAAAGYEGGAAAAGGGAERVLAVGLAAVYIATGVLAALDGWSLRNDDAKAMRNARRRAAQLAQDHDRLEGQVQRMRQAQARRQEQLRTGIDEATATARAAADALAAEAQHHARVLIAMHLGDPASSGVAHQPVRQPARTPDPATPPHAAA
jgi:hypothetical protein